MNLCFRCLLIFWLTLSCTVSLFAQSPAQPLDRKAQTIVRGISESIKQAAKQYHAKQFEQAGQTLVKAMQQLDVAVKAGSPDLYDALNPSMQRIMTAHAMLQLEGLALPPFRKPDRPSATASIPQPDKPTSPPSPTSNGVSFVSQVAPILAQRCGSCHIRGSKGGFSTATFAELMKGPPEGVVVFAGDVIGSRLIETIETGDMPRGGGKVSPMELTTLKQWITEGAKFDGQNPMAPLTANATPANAPATPTMTPISAATGNESVDFAADVAPLLVENCSGCHIDAMQTRGGLRMDTLAQIFRGGDSGQVLQPGAGEASLLVRKLRGTEGDRMPAGGRPPLSDPQIKLISTWIEEGAKVDPAMQDLPVTVITQKAWLARATPSQVTNRRAELASDHFGLAGANPQRLAHLETDAFSLWGDVPESTLQTIASAAEQTLKKASTMLASGELERSGADAESIYGGKASIYVLPRRYDYSEFAKMVERRGIPSDWKGHWKYDGIAAYVAMVASESDTPEEIQTTLTAPLVSLTVASRDLSVPRWFADGIGRVAAEREIKRDRRELASKQAELITAVGSLQNGKDFFAGKLPPERADQLAAAVCESFFSRDRKRGLDVLMRQLDDGKPFNDAFLAGMGVNPTDYFDAWLNWVK